MMLEKDIAVELATKLVEAGIEVDVQVKLNLDPPHPDEPAPTAWSVIPKPAMDLSVVTKIAAEFGLVPWMGFGGQGTVNFKQKGAK